MSLTWTKTEAGYFLKLSDCSISFLGGRGSVAAQRFIKEQKHLIVIFRYNGGNTSFIGMDTLEREFRSFIKPEELALFDEHVKILKASMLETLDKAGTFEAKIECPQMAMSLVPAAMVLASTESSVLHVESPQAMVLSTMTMVKTEPMPEPILLSAAAAEYLSEYYFDERSRNVDWF